MFFKDLSEIEKVTRPSDWWTKYFLHPFSTRLVGLLGGTKVTPNQLTVSSFLLILLAFPLLCWGNYFLGVIAAFLLQLSLILDCADGQLARIKKIDSAFGVWLDRGTDKVKDFLILFSLTLKYSKLNSNAWIFGFICFFIITFIDFLGFQFKLSPILPAQEDLIDKKEINILINLKKIKRKAGLNLFQIGEQYFFYTAFIILNRIDWLFNFIIIYGSLAILWVLFNTYREKRLLD